MINISIDEKLKGRCPGAALGCLKAKVNVEPGSGALWQEIEAATVKARRELALESLTLVNIIKESREAYKALGKDPSRYRLSSEALLRRILQGKPVYRINNVVDINNLISITSYYSVGSYDLDKLSGPVVFTVGGAGESYKGIGKEIVNIENLPVFADEGGKFGSPTSDSEKAMITSDTKTVLMNIISFSGPGYIEGYLQKAGELLAKYAGGEDFEYRIIE